MRPGRKLYARHTMRLTLIPRFPYGYFRDLSQRYRQTSEKLRSLLLYFSQRVQGIFAVYCKDSKNLRNNGRMRVKFDKWLVHIPFLCYLTILLNLAEGAVYGGY